MSDATIIFFLSICIGLLVCVVLYQQFVFRKGTEAKMRAISNKLKEIIETDSDERIMLFTENKELMELAAQINDLLEKHLKTKADYRRSEIASKKMLSNISHDIKTPMTVILGYLEIMQLSETPSKEMLKKVERKAQSVMELINQFFTLWCGIKKVDSLFSRIHNKTKRIRRHSKWHVNMTMNTKYRQ